MSFRRVLLIVKKSAMALSKDGPKARGDARMRALIAERHRSIRTLELSHEENLASARQVRRELRSRGIDFVERSGEATPNTRGFDLVITVGGDGTLLRASHGVRGKVVLLGVNSSPTFSVGFLTGCRAPTFAQTLDRLIAGELTPIVVHRLRVRVGKKNLPLPVLNDVLYCADNPAVTTRYRLICPDGDETQKSSGVWISTPAGSTAALRSAGGPTLPLTGKAFAYAVREAYAPPGGTVVRRAGVLEANQRLTIEARSAPISVFCDGAHRKYPVAFGELVTFSLHPQPLLLVRQTG